MLRAVVFDMDGVIVDSEPLHYKVCKRLFKELNINISDEEYISYIGTSNPDMWLLIKEKYGLQQSVDELVSNQTRSTLNYFADSDERPIPGIRELLEQIKQNDIKIGIASSASMKLIKIILEKFNIDLYFDAIVSGESLEKSKPDPTIFLNTSKLLNVVPSNCLVIEDSRNGVVAAKAAGMKCIGFSNPNSGKQDLSYADLIVESIKDLNLQALKEIFN